MCFFRTRLVTFPRIGLQCHWIGLWGWWDTRNADQSMAPYVPSGHSWSGRVYTDPNYVKSKPSYRHASPKQNPAIQKPSTCKWLDYFEYKQLLMQTLSIHGFTGNMRNNHLYIHTSATTDLVNKMRLAWHQEEKDKAYETHCQGCVDTRYY